MPRIFQGYSECRFHGSENDRYYLKIAKSQHKHAQENKRGRWITYFLDNTAKTCSYRPKISENLEIKHVFQSKPFFFFITVIFSTHVASMPFCHTAVKFQVHTSCHSQIIKLEPRPTHKKKRFFWSNPYKNEIMRTYLIEMLELPNFAYITISTV